MKDIRVYNLTGKNIQEARSLSFKLNQETVCELIALFVKTTDNLWHKVTVSDGTSLVELLDKDPILTPLSSVFNEFDYPIRTINKPFLYGQIVCIKEYLWQGKPDESNGLYFELEHDKSFSLIDQNDCLLIIEGMHQKENFELVDFQRR
ncbi:hypothetical protein GO730_20795 [Spirosoma sp. HMF3257]|uniref:Uncharacterized protein n=1 Tax=Spirosoma telluris TaxID=2183553 RepID=A0A327NL96_9BACT|nr:hypothetical protein [Spirosoma telluris]RAI75987.1 hypothetical protein HMF3257_20720 [Spirosoma telluris]